MESIALNTIKKELNYLPPEQLAELCLRLSRYKRENKELLSYLLFDAHDEAAFIEKVKADMDEQFINLPKTNLYIVKKSLRKILKSTNKFIKFSGIKQTEVELLIYFSLKMKTARYSNTSNTLLTNLYDQQLIKINKAIEKLHEDLQFDYQKEVEKLRD
ncbi:MAG: hypothetical protein ACKVQB_00590 [Bacteroidia bacterium]